jgi:fucose permease
MWGMNAAAPLNTVQLGYGIGAVLVNLLVRPFLVQRVSSINMIEKKPNIFIPYTITAVLCILTAVGHIFFYIRELKTQREKLDVRQVKKKMKLVLTKYYEYF